jgi:hypothetical protein
VQHPNTKFIIVTGIRRGWLWMNALLRKDLGMFSLKHAFKLAASLYKYA